MTHALSNLLRKAALRAARIAFAASWLILSIAPVNAQFDRAAHRQMSIFDRVQQDLDHANAVPYIAPYTRGRIDHARKEIWKFQERWVAGRYDPRRLDGAISAVHHVVESASLEYHDRRTLQDDLGHMREFRAEHEYRAYGFR